MEQLVNIERQPDKTMILRVSIGEGEVRGEKFDIGYSGKGLVWYFTGEGRYYTISYNTLTEAVLKDKFGDEFEREDKKEADES